MEINNFTGMSAARQFYQQLPLMQWSEDLLERMRNIATRWIKMTDIKSNPSLVDRIISVFVPANSSSAATGIGTAPSPFFLTMLTVTAIFLLSTLAFNFFKRKEAFEKNEKLLEDLALAVECNRVEAWFDIHPDQTYPPFSQLSTSQQLKAAALLVQIGNHEKLTHWTSVLSDDLREFQSWLSNQDPLSTSDTFLQQFSQENRAIALALKVNKNKIRIQDIRGNINDELLLQMAPTLRYLDLIDIYDRSLVLKLIRNCPNVYRLYINSYCIENLSIQALPLCQTLDCSGCIALKALPTLPLCQTLNCSSCIALTALPELPLCQTLNCSLCMALKALPELPLCQTLRCWDCIALTALPALPRCQVLDCSHFNALKELPELPLCQTLNCSLCSALTALPALPMCQTLNCSFCSALTALPELPMCQTLECRGCSALTHEKLLEDLAFALENNDVEAWFDMHPDQTYPPFSQLSTSQQLKAAALLVQLRNHEKLTHWTSVLSNDLREFQSWLSNQDPLSTSDTFLQQFSQENRAIALALKVNKNKIHIQGIRGNINDELLLQMAPTLRYLNLKNILDDSLVLKLIRNCPNVYRLHINSYCIENLSIQALPLCQMLYCRGCSALTALPALPLCKELYCGGCSELTTLPELPLCQTLDCYDCRALTALPELPMCKTLECSDCRALTALPALPMCETLDCRNCRALTALPALPQCQALDCRGCRALMALPELPPGVRVFSDDTARTHYERWEINFKLFTENPKQLLRDLGQKYLLQNRPLPNIDYLVNGQRSGAIDVGGVRRDFISRLSEQLFSHEGSPQGHLSIDEDGGWIPRAKSDEEVEYQALGRLLALCHPQDSAYKTGPLFDPLAYDILASLPPNEEINITWKNSAYLQLIGLPSTLSQLTHHSKDQLPQLNPEEIVKAIYLTDDNADLTEGLGFFRKKENQEAFDASLTTKAAADRRVNALALIAIQMRSAIGMTKWEQLHQSGGTTLLKRIEGELNSDLLLSKLQWDQSSPAVSRENLNKTQGFLEAWIRTASDERLRLFVRTVSGSNSLSSTPLQMQVYNRGENYIPVAHACFFALELSAEYPDPDTFNQKLEVLLTEGMAQGGFQII